ncbi:MAG: prolipoprotein diacylglyceryl transferase [Planctomycetes bacterium]|nr:prolipoprotein diacylglyceryl transferase [Planctomycetota bacterium]
MLEVAGVRIAAHTLFEAAGYAVGFQAFRALRKRRGDVVDGTARWTVLAAAAVGAALGSKLLFWLDDPAATWAHRADLPWLLGGKTIVGGILGGWAAVEWIKGRTGVTTRTGDLFAAPLCIGIAVGRIGCFSGGLADHTYGLPSELPWAVDFGDGVPRHPTQLYEAAFVLALAVPLARWTLRRGSIGPDGAVFRAFVATYCAWRIAIEFLKPRAPTLGLTGIQWACVAAIAVVVATWKPRASAPSETSPKVHPEVQDG